MGSPPVLLIRIDTFAPRLYRNAVVYKNLPRLTGFFRLYNHQPVRSPRGTGRIFFFRDRRVQSRSGVAQGPRKKQFDPALPSCLPTWFFRTREWHTLQSRVRSAVVNIFLRPCATPERLCTRRSQK